MAVARACSDAILLGTGGPAAAVFENTFVQILRRPLILYRNHGTEVAKMRFTAVCTSAAACEKFYMANKFARARTIADVFYSYTRRVRYTWRTLWRLCCSRLSRRQTPVAKR